MKRIVSILSASAALAALLTAPAMAQTGAATLRNTQIDDTADVWGYAGNQAGVALGANGAAIALGNTGYAGVQDTARAAIDNTQRVNGRVESHAQNYVRESGPVSSTATTYGNSFSGDSQRGAIAMDSNQASGGFLNARALVEATEYAQGATASATTGANTATLAAQHANVRLNAQQSNTAGVQAQADIEAPYADIPAAVGTAIAVINNADIGARGNAHLDGVQTNSGVGAANVSVRARGANAAVGNAVITGNNLNLFNEGGVGVFTGAQTNSGELVAQTVIDMGVFPGQASGAATAIGNNAAAVTQGPGSTINTTQNNSGRVVGQALFTGGSGGIGATSATAYGNAVNGTLCDCDGALNAVNHQTNSGAIRAHTYNLARDASVMSATSIAAGNTATYMIGAR